MNLLFTIMSVMYVFADFTDVLAGKNKDVGFIKEGSTLFFFLFEETEYHRANSLRMGAGITHFNADTLRQPLARAKAIALFAIEDLNKNATFVNTQGVHYRFEQCVKTTSREKKCRK